MVQVEIHIYTILTEVFVQKSLQPKLKQLVSNLEFYFILTIGSFVTTKTRPTEALAHIHSKPVNYTNNGGGRDTYISDSAGGLKQIY
jgi:hypothetical protein